MVPGFAFHSLRNSSARRHLYVALALVAIIPLLCFVFILVNAQWTKDPLTFRVQIVVSGIALCIALLGYGLLRRYPRDIETLSDHLRDMAEGRFPAAIRLKHDTKDARSIAGNLEKIFEDNRHRMQLLGEQLAVSERMRQTIHDQEQRLLEAEQHRVMIESLSAACHHLGQPATILQIHLESIAQKTQDSATKSHVKECREAIHDIAKILERLRNLDAYRTIPYLAQPDGHEDSGNGHILDIEA